MNELSQATAIPISKNATNGTVYVQDSPVNYYDSGRPLLSINNREPIVLVHGSGGNAQMHYGHLFPMLELNQRVIALDFSPVSGEQELTLGALENQIITVIEQVLPDTPVTLVGYSLGAVVCACVAAKRPDLVKNLVLIASWMKTDAQQLLRNEVWQ